MQVVLIADNLRQAARRADVSTHIYTASAGTGKTSKLADILEEALLGLNNTPRCRPEGVIAMTFARKAAAELRERSRVQLLAHGHTEAAQELPAALIGTVNAVCGRLVSEFSLQLGLSPDLRILDEAEAAAALAQCLSASCGLDEQQELSKLAHNLVELNNNESYLSWQGSVRQLVDLARANGLTASELRASGARSIESLLELLGPPPATAVDIESALLHALEHFTSSVDLTIHVGKNTRDAMRDAESARDKLRKGWRLPWCDWIKLATLDAGAKLRGVVSDVHKAAAAHDRHPLLRRELARTVELIFAIAARTLDAYQAHKMQRGAMDFIDQEVLALRALDQPDIQSELRHRLDLVLVDEFQDTSPLQLAIFLKLSELAPRSVWVGDQKQAIYSFRGTDPTLMDAAIEQVEGHGELLDKALDQLTHTSKVETLLYSWRSRPPLVRLTSKLFARAFAPHGIPPSRVEITAGIPDDPPGLGPYIEHWALHLQDNTKTQELASALAAGVRQMLQDPSVRVRGRVHEGVRGARPADVGVLCLSNAQCSNVAAALEALGITAKLPRQGVLHTLEGSVIIAGLHLWRDARSPSAKATLSRLLGPLEDPTEWLDAAIAQPRGTAFDNERAIQSLLRARQQAPTSDVVTILDLCVDALGLRERCLEWGDSAQRLANIDAVRSMVVEYARQTTGRGEACTLAGVLYRLQSRLANADDPRAVIDQDNAVCVSTWHAAKGLEWPIVVLFGLESRRNRPTAALGARAETPDGKIDLRAPLSGRWIRYWTTPYRGANTRMPFHARLTAHPLAVNAQKQRDREELRLLYVGWTRARDRLVLAAHDYKDNFSSGMLRHLSDANGALISVPDGPTVTWADETFEVLRRDLSPEAPVVVSPLPGAGYQPRPARSHLPARVLLSQTQSIGAVANVASLGERVVIVGSPDMNALGQAVHAFLAADDPSYSPPERLAMATELLQAWQVSGSMAPTSLLFASDNLRGWAASRWQVKGWLSEVPLEHRHPNGTLLIGRADLLIEVEDGYVLVDHKSYPGTLHEAHLRAVEHAGQLIAYRDAIQAATGKTVLGCFIHLPIGAAIVEIVAA